MKSPFRIGLRQIFKWGDQWNMFFNQDSTKRAQKLNFTTKLHSPKHSYLYFNSLLGEKVKTQIHLGLTLDEKLIFNEHL